MGLAADPKAERAKEGRAGDELGDRIVFTVNGDVHRIYLNRVTSNDVAALREAVGKSFRMVMHAPLDLDIYSTFLWMERRQNGEPSLPFALAPSLTYSDECVVLADDPEPAAEVGSPEG